MQNDDIETRLKSLSPVSSQMDAVTAAFAAGQRSSNRAINRWRSIAGVIAIVAIAPWLMPKSKPAIVVQPTIAISDPLPLVTQIEPVSAGNIWQLRQAVLDKGLDGLPKTEIAPAKPVRAFGTY